MSTTEIRHFHLFCGLGGGAKGFNAAAPRVGLSDQAWRERIGNAVPSAAAQAIGEVMGRTLLLAWSGETFELSAQPIWVRPIAVALSVQAGAGGLAA